MMYRVYSIWYDGKSASSKVDLMADFKACSWAQMFIDSIRSTTLAHNFILLIDPEGRVLHVTRGNCR